MPLDVINDFLRHLQSDRWYKTWPDSIPEKEDLHACTLVCRTWRPLAQRYLFHDICYSFVNSSDDSAYGQVAQTAGRWVASDIHYPRWVPRKTFNMFYDFLRQSPNFAAHVRRLAFMPRYPGFHSPSVEYEVGLALFIDLMERLPQLRELVLNNFTLEIPAEFHFPSPPCGPSLSRLSILRRGLQLSAPGLAAVLGCFSGAKELRLIGMDLLGWRLVGDDPHGASSLVPASLAKVHRLTLNAAEPQKYMGVLSRFIRLDTVRSITFMPQKPSLYQSLIDATTSSLEELTVCFTAEESREPIREYLRIWLVAFTVLKRPSETGACPLYCCMP